MRALILIGILLIPTLGHAAVTVDAITSGEGLNNGNMSVSHTGAADATLALVCVTERSATNTLSGSPTLTYGGNSMTLVSGATINQSSRVQAELYAYVSPPSGSQTVNFTRSTNSDRYIMSVITLKGTASSNIFNTAGTFGSTGATNINIDGLASSSGELAILCGIQATNAPVVSPDATAPTSTEQIEVDHTDGTGLTHFVYTEAGASSSINMRVDSDTSQYTAAVAVSILPAGGGSSFGIMRRRGY